MNEGGDNDWLLWENKEVWSFLNSGDDLVGSGEKFAGDKLTDHKSDTYQLPISVKEMVEPTTTVGRKRNSPNQKKDGKEKGKAKVGADGEGEPNHDTHTQTERERRKKMGELITELHGFLPRLSPKFHFSNLSKLSKS
ncbi:hypothetical protein HAX54_050382 [Datura stramonium]|uniref:BHLH domain-containing protein n=1 Tax=Datura stramonium TaxID=4076 RepID=A0ABS8WLB0_DATST|nr:hypothetical protein [Datura stramonium]